MAYAAAVVAVGTSPIIISNPNITTLDGVSLVNPSRILLTGQSPTSQNGVWVWTAKNTALARPTGQDQYATTNTLDNNTLIWVQNGNTLAGTCWGIDPAQVTKVDTTSHTLTRVALPPVQARVASVGTNITIGSALPSIDGITTTSTPPLKGNGTVGSDVILLKDQTTASQNGLYYLNTGTGSWNRVSEPLTPQRVVRVQQGTLNANTDWAIVTPLPIQLGTTGITFSKQLVRANVRDFGASGNGTTDDSAHIAAAIAAVTANGGTVLFPAGIYKIGSAAAVTTPSNVQVTFEEGAILAPSGLTVTLNGRVSAHPTQQVFGGTGPVGAVTATGTPTPPSVTVTGAQTSYSFVVQVVSGVSNTVTIGGGGGMGYTSASTVVFSPSPYGVTATGMPIISGGKVTSVTVTSAGSGYISPPSIGFEGPGSGATATATLPSVPAGTMTFRYSINGGAGFSPITPSSATVASSLSPTGTAIPAPPLGGGATITFGTGSYAAGDTYTWTSTPAIVLSNLASDVFHAKWWGATGTGSTDDTAAIQAAIIACQSAGGGKVRLPAGSYATSAELALTSGGVWLEGAGNQFGVGTTLTANSKMRSLIKSASPARGTSVANRISDINLNCALNATFGVYRCGDLFAEYHRLGIRNAVIDGFHETSTGDGYTIGPITYVGTGTPPVVQVVPAPYTAPLVGGGAETLTVEVVAGGSLGTAIFAISYSGGAPGAQVTSLPGGNYNVQFPTSLTGIGVIWQFGAGTYASGATFSCTVTSISQLNDNAQFRDCVIDGCGLIFGTSTMLGPTQYQGFGFNLQTATPLTGTVTMTQGSSTISGSGTNFTITGARTGDFIRFGFPAWQAGSMYSAGNYVTAPGPAAGTAAAAPGLLFVWQCMTTHTAVAPITWPTQGNLPGSSPIGETVADGAGNIWTCMAYTTYQILDVQDDQTILIGEFCAPANTISSVDYAICVGSGSFDEISEDVSENSWIGGSITSAAAAGLMTVAPFGMKAQSMQCQSCGAVGFAIGLAGIECKNCVLDEVYCEANFAADYWCECSGLTLIQPELGTLNGGVVCPDASGASYGTWIGNVGNAQSTVAMQPIGTFSYSTMPVTGSSKQLFSFAGPLAVLPNTQEIGSMTQINPNISSLVYLEASDAPETLVTSVPTIGPGRDGQQLTIFNYGANRLVLQSYKQLTGSTLALPAQFLTLGFLDSATFIYANQGFGGPFWLLQDFNHVPYGVDNKANSVLAQLPTVNNNFFTYGVSRMVLAPPTPPITGPFAFTGFIGDSAVFNSNNGTADGQDLLIVNYYPQSMTFYHLDSRSVAVNQILCPGGVAVTVSPSASTPVFTFARLQYSSLANSGVGAWLLLEHS